MKKQTHPCWLGETEATRRSRKIPLETGVQRDGKRAEIHHRHSPEIEQICVMSQTTLAVLEQIRALSEEERRELIAALPALPQSSDTVHAGLDKVYEALAWRYEGEPDDAARVDDLQR